MPAVLAVSSYPYRTSPVLRGAWILESILGTPPPPPPADVPALEKQASAEAPKSVREMLTPAPRRTRRAPAATAASTRWALRWRTTISSAAGASRMPASPSTTAANCRTAPWSTGPQSLKAALLDRKDLFVRNLTAEDAGLCAGPRPDPQDSCTVDRIVAELKDNDYRAQKLIELILLERAVSIPGARRGRGPKEPNSEDRHAISRRTLLRGAGVTLGLPWLEAMMPSAARRAAGAQNPVRMAMLYMPNGVNVAHWYPKGTGRDFELSATLEPLAGLQDQILVLSNLWNAGAKAGDGHYVKESSILTCATIKKTPGVDLANGTSVDQLAAQKSRQPDAAALPGTGDRAGSRRRRSGCGIHADLRLAHFVEQSQHSAGAGTESASGVRAAVSRRFGPEGTPPSSIRCCSTACLATRSGCAPKSAPPTACGWTNTSR